MELSFKFLLQVVEAAQTGNVDVIREFIVRGGDVNRTWENYWKEGDGPGATSGRDPGEFRDQADNEWIVIWVSQRPPMPCGRPAAGQPVDCLGVGWPPSDFTLTVLATKKSHF